VVSPDATTNNAGPNEFDDLVEHFADPARRTEAMAALVGGVTATELRAMRRLPESVFDALQRGLRHGNPKVRWWCIQILDHVADERSLWAVADLLGDPIPRVRRNAVHALGCTACKPEGGDLPPGLLQRITAIASNDPSPKVRAEARYALACRIEAQAG
jgi:HEAT repeat protein